MGLYYFKTEDKDGNVSEIKVNNLGRIMSIKEFSKDMKTHKTYNKEKQNFFITKFSVFPAKNDFGVRWENFVNGEINIRGCYIWINDNFILSTVVSFIDLHNWATKENVKNSESLLDSSKKINILEFLNNNELIAGLLKNNKLVEEVMKSTGWQEQMEEEFEMNIVNKETKYVFASNSEKAKYVYEISEDGKLLTVIIYKKDNSAPLVYDDSMENYYVDWVYNTHQRRITWDKFKKYPNVEGGYFSIEDKVNPINNVERVKIHEVIIVEDEPVITEEDKEKAKKPLYDEYYKFKVRAGLIVQEYVIDKDGKMLQSTLFANTTEKLVLDLSETDSFITGFYGNGDDYLWGKFSGKEIEDIIGDYLIINSNKTPFIIEEYEVIKNTKEKEETKMTKPNDIAKYKFLVNNKDGKQVMINLSIDGKILEIENVNSDLKSFKELESKYCNNESYINTFMFDGDYYLWTSFVDGLLNVNNTVLVINGTLSELSVLNHAKKKDRKEETKMTKPNNDVKETDTLVSEEEKFQFIVTGHHEQKYIIGVSNDGKIVDIKRKDNINTNAVAQLKNYLCNNKISYITGFRFNDAEYDWNKFINGELDVCETTLIINNELTGFTVDEDKVSENYIDKGDVKEMVIEDNNMHEGLIIPLGYDNPSNILIDLETANRIIETLEKGERVIPLEDDHNSITISSSSLLNNNVAGFIDIVRGKQFSNNGKAIVIRVLPQFTKLFTDLTEYSTIKLREEHGQLVAFVSRLDVLEEQSYQVDFNIDCSPVTISVNVYHTDTPRLSKREIIEEALGYVDELGVGYKIDEKDVIAVKQLAVK